MPKISSSTEMVFHNLLIIMAVVLLMRSTFVQGKPIEQSDISGVDGDTDTKNPIDLGAYYGNLSAATIRKIQQCDRDMGTMELCMRCAKVTKSAIVYPMCCDNEENVKDWCHDYIYFGNRK